MLSIDFGVKRVLLEHLVCLVVDMLKLLLVKVASKMIVFRGEQKAI